MLDIQYLLFFELCMYINPQSLFIAVNFLYYWFRKYIFRALLL